MVLGHDEQHYRGLCNAASGVLAVPPCPVLPGHSPEGSGGQAQEERTWERNMSSSQHPTPHLPHGRFLAILREAWNSLVRSLNPFLGQGPVTSYS